MRNSRNKNSSHPESGFNFGDDEDDSNNSGNDGFEEVNVVRPDFDLPVLFDVDSHPVTSDENPVPAIPLEEFSEKCKRYFEETLKKPGKKVISPRGKKLNELPVPFTLDGLCLTLGITKNEFLLYSKLSPKHERTVEFCKMMINEHLITQGLLGNYERQVVWNLIKNMDSFYKDRIVGEENTADNAGGGKGGGNINMVVVGSKADLKKLKKDKAGKIIDIVVENSDDDSDDGEVND